MTDHDFWLMIRKVILEIVDIIERKLEIQPRTAEIRKNVKRGKIELL